MYFKNATPESAGIASRYVSDLIKTLNKHNIPMHSLLIARGNKLFCEAYWQPFNSTEIHRMYSQTKSYVGIAISQLAAEGKLNLTDKIVDFFPEYLPEKVHPYLAAQTIENMLNMQTCFTDCQWFENHGGDRIKYYFSMTPIRYPGTTYYYDSTGSFVLAALVQRLTGKTFLDYLKEKCLNKIGFSKESKVLDCPGGFAWGDSALLCTTMDMLLFGKLLANKGNWNGEQLLDKLAAESATATPVSCRVHDGLSIAPQGYGRQIWGTYDHSFCFFGMHGQFMIYNPRTDIIMACTAGWHRESSTVCREILFGTFFEKIVNKATDSVLPESVTATELDSLLKTLKLTGAIGNSTSSFAEKISGKTFKAEANPMGITDFSIALNEDGGIFSYTNAQGEKCIKFGFGENIIQPFPQTGYSKDIGGMPCDGNRYKCAASAAWIQQNKLKILVQIIDEYIGILDITIGFCEDKAVIEMVGDAENFLKEYNGYLTAEQK